MIEHWKPINEKYEVSDLGRVRNAKTGHVITDIDHGNGYRYVTFVVDGKHRNYYVHRLVAEAFLPRSAGRDYVDHLNFNRADNRAENLIWCTQLENVRRSAHRMRHPNSVTHSSTGEQYIYKRGDRFRVAVLGKEIQCRTLEEAIRIREVMKSDSDYFAERS